MKLIKICVLSLIIASINFSCRTKYSLNNINISNAKTFEVDFFQNNANLIEPGLDRDFTLALQDLILNQNDLELVNTKGDLFYEGEITEYRIYPNVGTNQNKAAQNRLSISVKVHFINRKNNKELEKPFSFFFDYPANKQLIGNLKKIAHEQIFERITQDIINSSLSNW